MLACVARAMPVPVSLTASITCGPGVGAQVLAGHIGVELDISGLDRQLAAGWHRVPRVHDQVHHHLFDAARIDQDSAEAYRRSRDQVDVLAQNPPQHLIHSGEHAAQIEHFRRDQLLAAEGRAIAS